MEEKIYKHETKSLDELAVLLALGADLDDVDKSTKFFTFFLSSKDVDLKSTCMKLASGKLEINASDLLSAYKRAKSISHSRENRQSSYPSFH